MSTFVSFHDLTGNKILIRADNVEQVTPPTSGYAGGNAVLRFTNGTSRAVRETVETVHAILEHGNAAVNDLDAQKSIKHGGERGGPVL